MDESVRGQRDREDLPAERGIGYLAYSPFGGPAGPLPQAALAVARRRGASAHRVLLVWLRQQSPNIVPLAGASGPALIRDSAAWLDLTDQGLEDLRAAEEALREYEDGFRADLEPVSDPAFDGAPWEVVRAARTPAESAAVRRAGDDVGGRYPCGTGGMLLTMSIAFSDRTESQ